MRRFKRAKDKVVLGGRFLIFSVKRLSLPGDFQCLTATSEFERAVDYERLGIRDGSDRMLACWVEPVG